MDVGRDMNKRDSRHMNGKAGICLLTNWNQGHWDTIQARLTVSYERYCHGFVPTSTNKMVSHFENGKQSYYESRDGTIWIHMHQLVDHGKNLGPSKTDDGEVSLGEGRNNKERF
jgi:hypothetical protein